MRIARNFGLLVATVVATLTMATPHASAQAVEVEEATGGHCGTVTLPTPHEASGMCEIEAHTLDMVITAHFSAATEVVGSICESEFEGYVASNGSGYLTHPVQRGPNCLTPPCPEMGTTPDGEYALWPMQIFEAAPEEKMRFTFCIITSFGRVNCEIEVDMVGGPGAYGLEAEDRRCLNIAGFPNFEITTHWDIEAQEIEIHH